MRRRTRQGFTQAFITEEVGIILAGKQLEDERTLSQGPVDSAWVLSREDVLVPDIQEKVCILPDQHLIEGEQREDWPDGQQVQANQMEAQVFEGCG